MVLNNAHVVDYLQGARGWHDGTLEADHWAALGDIAPIDAAMLLCRLNPNEHGYEDAKLMTTDELGPAHLIRLAQRLADIDKADHKPRTLRDWHHTARGMGLVYHSWIDGYIEATTPPAPPVADTAPPDTQVAPAVAVVALVEAGKAGPVANWKMQIQAEATAHCLTLRKSGASPTKHSILDAMVRWCRVNNVKTDTKIFPSANYLRTHVLGGKHWELPN